MNCEKLSFSQKLSVQRINQAETLLGKKIIQKIITYALFLLGVSRSEISSFLNMPPGSIRALMRAINNFGLAGIEDQRAKTSSFKPPLAEQITPTLNSKDSRLEINFGIGNLTLQISEFNPVQKKVILLSLLNSDFLNRSEVADALHLSVDRTVRLAKKLEQEDVNSIIDQRHGQRQDYRFTPEIKAELIQQFIIETIAHRQASGEQLAKKLQDRCQLTLSARSILYHLSKLGLYSIRDSLSEHLTELKKNP